MYLVSLNVDLSFGKAFSSKRIAKRFLEDFFGIRITEIKLLRTVHKITDGAVVVKFDFRCKIRGKYVIIEMQQKYKPDVNKRFYLYHCLNTALQLETLEPIVVIKPDGKTYREKNYNGLEPVVTLVWMVDDTLNFKEDFIAFSTLPEVTKDFIADSNLWEQPLEFILAEREKVLKTLNNATKELDFFSENRIVYAFQQNIITNNKQGASYFPWFDFAQKSRNPNNTENDFLNLKKDAIMVELINRLKKDKFTEDELMYLSHNTQYEIMLFQKDLQHEKDIQRIQKRAQKFQAEQEKLQIELTAEQEKRQAEVKSEQEKRQAEQEKFHAERLKSIKKLLKRGETIDAIADIFELPVEEIALFVKEIEEENNKNTESPVTNTGFESGGETDKG